MTFREKRVRFTKMVSQLIDFALERGYEIAFQPEHSQHKRNSLHFKGLAKDFDLYKDGKWLSKTEDHRLLGDYWESLGGSWGGRFNDGNHYSVEHEGVK